MKAPRFWYQPEGKLARFLTPLENAYRFGSLMRRKFAHPYRSAVPVICVGNVVAGGAGKTPTALALAALLQERGHKPVFVTRGYGGKQRGPLLVDAMHHTAEDVGDEALLLLRQAPVWIGRDRVAAIRMAEKHATHIILDDGLQNPNLAPAFSLLVMDAVVGLGNGHIIPAGPLREPMQEALDRVNAVLAIGEGDLGALSKPVLRGTLQPAIPPGFPRQNKFLAFAGIGRPEKFYALCRKEGLDLAATEDFADHYPFQHADMEALADKARKLGAKLLTTEKDYVRVPAPFRSQVLTFPIRLQFEDRAAVERLLGSAL